MNVACEKITQYRHDGCSPHPPTPHSHSRRQTTDSQYKTLQPNRGGCLTDALQSNSCFSVYRFSPNVVKPFRFACNFFLLLLFCFYLNKLHFFSLFFSIHISRENVRHLFCKTHSNQSNNFNELFTKNVQSCPTVSPFLFFVE